MKKPLSLILALALAFSLAGNAFQAARAIAWEGRGTVNRADLGVGGGGIAAQSLSGSAQGWTVYCNGVEWSCEADATPTPIVRDTPLATATRTPTPRSTNPATPTQVASPTPQPTPTPDPGWCDDYEEVPVLAIRPQGRVWYTYTDPNKTGINNQNIRAAPMGAIIGSLPKGEARPVYWEVEAIDGIWVSLDMQCTQWVAPRLGSAEIRE